MFSKNLIKFLKENFPDQPDNLATTMELLHESINEVLKNLWNDIGSDRDVKKAETIIKFAKELNEVGEKVSKNINDFRDQTEGIETLEGYRSLDIPNEITVYCTGANYNSKGIFYPKTEEILVLDGSFIVLEEKDSLEDNLIAKRKGLKERNLLVKEGGALILKESQLFRSPSSAAKFVIARSANGWTEWRDAEGREINYYRKK